MQPQQMQPQQMQQGMAPMVGPKSKVAAGVLGILLGALGVHNFYMGHTGKGIAQLLITLLSIGFLSPVTAIWGLIEGIICLTSDTKTDGNGMLLS